MNLLSAFTTGSNVVNAIKTLAFGASGAVVLGPFSFDGFEVPEYVTVGGTQKMTVHTLPGGERVVDLLGSDEKDIEWSGTMIDGNPARRARQLDQMRADGKPLTLTWGTFLYTVLLKSFEAETHYSLIRYRISCLVLRNDATAPKVVDPSLTNTVAGDLLSAVNSATDAIAPVLVRAQAVVGALGPLIPGSKALAMAGVYLGVAQGAVTTAQTTAASGFSLVTGATGIVNGSTSLLAATGAAGTMAQLSQAGAYLGRAAKNTFG